MRNSTYSDYGRIAARAPGRPGVFPVLFLPAMTKRLAAILVKQAAVGGKGL